MHGERQAGRRAASLWIHTASSVAGAALTGLCLFLVGDLFVGLITQDAARLAVGTVGAAGVLYALRELDLIRVPAPQRRRQVPATWRDRFDSRT